MNELATLDISGLEEFEGRGQLCWVGLVDYRSMGEQKIILHEAKAFGDDAYAYGAGKCWIIDPQNVTKVRESAATDPDNDTKFDVNPVDNSAQ